MKKIVLLSLFLFSVALAHAQLQISGKMRSLKPITFVLEDLNGNVVLSQNVDKSGVFTTEKKEITPDLYLLKIGEYEIHLMLENKPFALNGFFNNQDPGASNLVMPGTELNASYKTKNNAFRRTREIALQSVNDFIASTPTSEEQLIMLAIIHNGKAFLDPNHEQMAAILEKCGTHKNSLAYKSVNQLKEEYSSFALNAPAFNFTAQDVNHKNYSLSDFKGKIVLLDFWASWCGPCRAEMKSLHAIYDEIKGDDLQFISLSLDDTKEKWEAALKTDNIPWLSLWEGVKDQKEGRNSGFQSSLIRPEYGFGAIPFIVLIDKEGRTVKRFLRGEDVKREIELLRKK